MGTLRQTHTYVELELSPAAYDEISRKLVEAGYGHCFSIGHEHGDAIDMHGLAVTRATAVPQPWNEDAGGGP